MSLGATRLDILMLVVCQGMWLALGRFRERRFRRTAAFALMANLLYGVKPPDPATFVTVAAGLGFVAILACYIPA
jgi:hypothetical protein